MKSTASRLIVLAVVGVLATVVWASPASNASAAAYALAQGDTEEPPPESTPDGTPQDPGDSEPEDSGVDTSGAVLIVVVVGAIALVFLAGRGSRGNSSVAVTTVPQAAPQAPTTDSRAARLRRSYADARGVLDTLDEREVARRRSGADPAETHRTVQAVFSDLASLEAEAPTALERSTLREAADAVSALNKAADDAASASVDSGDSALEPARERLERALDRLADQIRTYG